MQKNNKSIGNRCVIYARYSCSNQTEQSIEGQMHDCEQFAARNNLQIVNSYIDRANRHYRQTSAIFENDCR